MSDYETHSTDRFFDKYNYRYRAEYDQASMSIDYKEYDKDWNETFSVIHTNIDVFNSEEDIKRLEYGKKYSTYYKYHLCTTYALQKILDMSFEDAYMLQSRYGMKYRVIMNYAPCVFELLKDKGYTQVGEFIGDSEWKDISMRTILSEFKEGRYYFMLRSTNPKYPDGSHAVAYINGVLYSHSFEQLRTGFRANVEGKTLVYDTQTFLKDYYLQAYMYKPD